MRELASGLAQLAAIIMVLITLAVSTAAVSQWVNSETISDQATMATTSPALVSAK